MEKFNLTEQSITEAGIKVSDVKVKEDGSISLNSLLDCGEEGYELFRKSVAARIKSGNYIVYKNMLGCNYQYDIDAEDDE